MGLLQEGSDGLNAKLCDQSTPQMSTYHPKRAQYAPHKWTRTNYGATKQLATPLDTSPQILEEQKCRIQKLLEHSSTMPALCTALCYQPLKN